MMNRSDQGKKTQDANGGWHRIPNGVTARIVEIGTTAYAIYGVLSMHANQEGKSWPSVSRIAKMIGRGRNAVKRGLHRLQQHGLLTVSPRPGKTPIFILAPIRSKSTSGLPPKRSKSTSEPLPGPPVDLPPGPLVDPEQDSMNKTKEQHTLTASAGDGFDSLWEVYPKQSARRTAEKAYPEAVKDVQEKHGLDEAKAREFITGMATLFAKSEWGSGPVRMVPKLADWLTEGHYDDDPKAWCRKTDEENEIYAPSNSPARVR